MHMQTVQTPAMTPKVPHLNLKSLAGVLSEGSRTFHVPDTSMTEWGKSAFDELGGWRVTFRGDVTLSYWKWTAVS